MLSVVKLLFMTVAFGISLPMLREAVGDRSATFAFFTTIMSMGYLRYVYRVKKFGAPFSRTAAWEGHSRFYRRVGVAFYGRVLKRSPLKLLSPDIYLGRSSHDARAVWQYALEAEVIHFWAFLIIVPYQAYLAWFSAWRSVAVVGILQLLGNVYPYLHLRMTRARLEALALRRGSRSLASEFAALPQ